MNLKSLIEDKRNLFTVMLCILVMFSTTLAKADPFENARTINLLEILFIIALLVIFKERPGISKQSGNSPIVVSLLFLWAGSVLASFYFSPYQLTRFDIAWHRVYQTLSHVLLFCFLYHYTKTYGIKFRWVIFAIAASSLIVVAIHAATILSAPVENLANYFVAPPLNSHIRHTGYQITAAICFLLPMIYLKSNTPLKLANYTTLLILFTFLFWLGGRGAVLSVFMGSIFIGLALFLMQLGIKRLLATIVLCAVLGIVVSEYLAYFNWNGLMFSLEKTVAATDLNQVSTGRIGIWKSAFISTKDHLWFGLGPQAYIFSPNRIFGVQPHSFIFQFLVEWGLVGSTLFLLLLGLGFYTGLKKFLIPPSDDEKIQVLSAGGLIVAMVFHATFDGIFYHPQPSLYLAIAFAIWISPTQSARFSRMLDKNTPDEK